MPAETDQKLRSEILILFQYVQRLREEIGRIAQQPEGQTRFERMSDQLDAILISTGEATHTVLEGLEAISSTVEELRDIPDPAKVEKLCNRITEKSMEGMEACSFQDLTGQRISKIVRSLRFIEERVDAMMEICGREGIEALVGELPFDEEDLKDGVALHGPQLPGEAVSQDEIDKLFGWSGKDWASDWDEPANTVMFELHVNQNGDWKRLKTFDGRRDAMSAAFELERGRHYLGAKVFELVSDPEGMATKKKLLHRWSAEDDSRAAQQEVDENLDRQRQLRRKIRAKHRAENKGWKKRVWNIVVVSSLSLVLVSGLVGMLMLKAG